MGRFSFANSLKHTVGAYKTKLVAVHELRIYCIRFTELTATDRANRLANSYTLCGVGFEQRNQTYGKIPCKVYERA